MAELTNKELTDKIIKIENTVNNHIEITEEHMNITKKHLDHFDKHMDITQKHIKMTDDDFNGLLDLHTQNNKLNSKLIKIINVLIVAISIPYIAIWYYFIIIPLFVKINDKLINIFAIWSSLSEAWQIAIFMTISAIPIGIIINLSSHYFKKIIFKLTKQQGLTSKK